MATPLTITPPTRPFASLRPAPPPAPPPRSAILKIPANTLPVIHPRTTAPLPPPNQAGPVPQTLAVLLPQGRTINSSIAGPVVLRAADNPLTITGAGKVTSTGSSDGIDGPALTTWTISNAGVVSSASAYGISLASKGTITNSGTISGNDGVGLRAGGTVTNNGSISASGTVGGGLSVGSSVVISGSAGDLFVQGGLAADLALLWLLGSAFRTAYRGQSAGLVTLLCGITLFGMTNLIIRQPLFWFFIDDPGPINEHGGEEDVANCAQGYDEGRASFMSRHGHQEDLGSGTGCCSNIRYSTTRTAGVYNATTRRWRMRPRCEC